MLNNETATDTVTNPKTLLIITAGTTDLQLLAGVNGTPVRIPLPSRAWHEHFLNNPGSYQICPLDNLPSAIALTEFTSRLKVGSLSSEVWTLIPAKLGMAIRKLTGETCPPNKVIVFNTNRTKRKSEPVGVGPIVCRWLEQLWSNPTAEYLPFNQFEGQTNSVWPNSTRCSYVDLLSEEEKYEDSSGCVLEARIFDTLTAASLQQFDQILIADTGGVPQIKRVLELTARLVWGDGCIKSLRVAESLPDDAEKQVADKFVFWSDLNALPKMTPAPLGLGKPEWSPAYLQARILAKTLITRLNFPAAHAVAQTTPKFDKDKDRIQDTAWRDAAKGAADIVGGLMRNNWAYGGVTWWPQSDLVPAAGTGATTISQTLISAIRVECALQNGNWAAAMSQTCELFEWALFESVKKLGGVNNSEKLFTADEVKKITMAITNVKLSKSDGKYYAEGHLDAPLFLPKENSWDFRNGKNSDVLPSNGKGADGPVKTSPRNCKHTDGPAKIWARLIDAFKRSDSLTALYDSINEKPPGEKSIADFRNFQTHQGLGKEPNDPMSIKNACRAFVVKGLWADAFGHFPTDANDLKNMTPGGAFMAQPKIKAILKSVCGISDPAAEFATWVKRLEADMAKP